MTTVEVAKSIMGPFSTGITMVFTTINGMVSAIKIEASK
ncbi:hypothetical protein JCM19297_2301 [Nonlabens ulvanivorans]|nr:hypothetical protein JCM19297_2301 [Nonlabens ulvanivorans]